jgi:hypothetical protein
VHVLKNQCAMSVAIRLPLDAVSHKATTFEKPQLFSSPEADNSHFFSQDPTGLGKFARRHWAAGWRMQAQQSAWQSFRQLTLASKHHMHISITVSHSDMSETMYLKSANATAGCSAFKDHKPPPQLIKHARAFRSNSCGTRFSANQTHFTDRRVWPQAADSNLLRTFADKDT